MGSHICRMCYYRHPHQSMKERPILFSGPMVRAILEGKKTQTRRMIKRQRDMEFDINDPHFGPYWLSYATDAEGEDARVRCPYGEAGDRLWVRETWLQGQGPTWGSHCVVYDADKKIAWAPGSGFDNPDLKQFKKRPSIFMPRWASRITLEITGVRVERLQQISDADALAEGCSTADMRNGDSLASVYTRLWESIHGPGSWDANPWAWVVEFRKLTTTTEP
jgi:hypothetical protein